MDNSVQTPVEVSAYRVESLEYPVLLFDGVCNLCNGLVRFLLPRDRQAKLRFASLQSDFGQRLLRKQGLPAERFDSFILYADEHAYTKSEGVLRSLSFLPFPWPLFKVFYLVPRNFRDRVYDWVARNRYVWFGQLDNCPLPTTEQAARFFS